MNIGVVMISRPWKEFHPQGRFDMDEIPQILLNGHVHNLGLPICLWMVSRTHTEECPT